MMMASHFQLNTEILSDGELSRGFSFDAREANKQGQFSGPIPKSIVPGVHPSNPTIPTLPAQSPSQRSTTQYLGLDFASNKQVNIATSFGANARAEDQALVSASRNPSVSAHFSHRSDHNSPDPGDVFQSENPPQDRLEPSITFDFENCSPARRMCGEQDLSLSETERRPAHNAHHSTSKPFEGLTRGDGRQRGMQHLQREHSQCRTPPPRCGDLEDFGIYEASNTTRTPPSHVRMARRSHSQSLSFEIDSSLPRRNRSRASNISRKRRFGQTNHQTSEPDRKRLAMTEAVKHWNECIQITTEESNQARSTIHSLKKKLQRQANELQVAQSAVKTGKTDLQTLQEQLQDLTRQNTRYSQDKKSLENRIHELNVGYEKLRNQVKEMPAKFNGLEEKLVNTITEQRELFNKSKNLYTNLENQIKQGDVREKATAEAVEKALQSNKEKREEFKKVVEHMQHDFQYKTAEFERKIKTLEKENETQCDQIDALEEDKERFYNEIIASRTTRACIEKVDSQLSGLITQLRVLDASQDTVAIELRDMKTRVEDLRHDQDFAELKEQVSRSHAKLNSLENLIQGSLLPAIEGIATKQSESNASVTSLAAAAEGGWSKLQEQIQTHAIDLRKTMSNSNEYHAEVIDLLTLISAANRDVASRVEVGNSRLESLVEGVSPRGAIGTSIAVILESTQGLSGESCKVLSALERTTGDAQRFYEMLAGHVDAKFLSQEIVSRELITGLKKNFEAAFETLKENLGLQLSQWTNSRKSAPSDRKWLQDVEAVRLKLRQVESQLSKVDDVPLSLKKIYDMSVLIRETSRFMDKEEQWVQQTMGDRALHSDGSGTTDASASHISSSQSPACSRPESWPAIQPNPDDAACETQLRKVVVHSPGPRGDSPLPVTTAQEQRRRREPARPRSILKQSQNKVAATKSLAASARSILLTSEQAIADIRSTLILSPLAGSPSSNRATGLTPMTEYLRLNNAANGPEVCLGDLADANLAKGPTAVAAGMTAAV